MKTKIVKDTIWHFVEHLRSEDYEMQEFDIYEFGQVPEGLIDEAWYWYNSGNYCGDGWILMRKGDKYDLHCCSHCSCYGPIAGEHLEFTPNDLDYLIKHQSDGCESETKPLFDAMLHSEINKMIAEEI